MDDMEPPEQYVETVVEDIHVGIDPGEEIVTSDSTIVTSGIGMNTVVYSGPDGIIMEGDEISGDIVSDLDTLTVGKHSHILHSNSHHQNTGFIMENMLDDHSIVVSSSGIEPRFVAMKPQSVGEVVIGSSHVGQVILQESMGDEMIVEQSIEVGGDDDLSHGDIILVPNSMIKQEDIIEGGEVIVGSSDGNEIVIDHIGAHVGNGRFFISDDGDVSANNSMDSNFDDSRLVIDTEEQLRMEELPSVGYDCGECGAMLKTRASLKKHIKMYHGFVKQKSSKSKKSNAISEISSQTKNRLHCCTSCSYTTQRRDKLDKHMQKHVLFEGYHPCGKKRHKPSVPPQRHHHNAEEYKCPICPYTCTVYKALKKHNKLHIANGKHVVVKLSCKICGKDRSTEADLKKHMKKHCDGKIFMCDVCGFGSAQLKKIIQHRRMHTGEKPHLCPHCTYRSARRDNLRSHVRRMHKKENVYIDTFNPTEETNVAE